MRTALTLLGASMTTLLLAASPAQAAPETPVECNQVVTGTVKLANDLVCLETDGLIIGSDNTVIDLNGKRIVCIGAGYEGSCQGIVPPGGVSDPEFENGVDIDGKRNVHVFTSVPGATITGFDNGVNINRSSNVKVEHLVITGPPQSSDPANPRPASHGVLIRGANCGGGSLHIGTGQGSGNDISNNNQGIAINGDCVDIVHNRLHDNDGGNSARFGFPVAPPSNGLLISDGSRNVVRGNEVERNGDDDETIDAGIRIRRSGSTDNLITNNEVNKNLGDGILIEQNAAANFITNNTMRLNGGPLSGTAFYDAAGRDAPGGRPGDQPLNVWNQNNRCLTQNQEVPPGTCGPDEGK